jgi:hypothetical protein
LNHVMSNVLQMGLQRLVILSGLVNFSTVIYEMG